MRFKNQQITSFQHSFCFLHQQHEQHPIYFFNTAQQHQIHISTFTVFVSVFTSEPGTIPYLIAFLLDTFSLGISQRAKSSQNISCNMLLLAIQHIHVELPSFCILFSHQHVHIHQHIYIKYSKNTQVCFFSQEFCQVANRGIFPVGGNFLFSVINVKYLELCSLLEMCPLQSYPYNQAEGQNQIDLSRNRNFCD